MVKTTEDAKQILAEEAKKHKPQSQTRRVLEILSDLKPHSNYEIVDTLFPGGRAGLFRLSARILDLNRIFMAMKGAIRMTVDGAHDVDDQQKYWYQIAVTNLEGFL